MEKWIFINSITQFSKFSLLTWCYDEFGCLLSMGNGYHYYQPFKLIAKCWMCNILKCANYYYSELTYTYLLSKHTVNKTLLASHARMSSKSWRKTILLNFEMCNSFNNISKWMRALYQMIPLHMLPIEKCQVTSHAL